MKRKIKKFFLIILYFILTIPIFLLGIYFIIKNPETDFSIPLGIAEGIAMVLILMLIGLFYEEKEENN